MRREVGNTWLMRRSDLCCWNNNIPLTILLMVVSSASLKAQNEQVPFSEEGYSPAKKMEVFSWRLLLSSEKPPILKPNTAPAVVVQRTSLPLFCRIEHQLGQQMALPLKFRLGDVPYVDRLEGKRRWYE